VLAIYLEQLTHLDQFFAKGRSEKLLSIVSARVNLARVSHYVVTGYHCKAILVASEKVVV